MTRPIRMLPPLTVALLAVTLLLASGGPAGADKNTCYTANTDNDLIVTTTCSIPIGLNVAYRNVHVITKDGSKGVLNFEDGAGETHFWAKAILVEDGGSLTAGTRTSPFGTKGGKLTIHLYGETQASGASGVPCKSTPAETCGAPQVIWGSNAAMDPATAKKVENLNLLNTQSYKGPKDDYFYAYHPLPYDDGNHNAYFGNKVLGVSYGGALKLFGKKGAIYDEVGADKSCKPTGPDSEKSTGRSWVRLAKSANKGEGTIYVETPACGLDWAAQDDIVLTTTDYLPGHSEQLKIKDTPTVVKSTDTTDTKLVGTTKINLTSTLKYIHNGARFPLDNTNNPGISRLGLNADLTSKGAETRAAVGLLSRSIRVVSAGKDTDKNKDLPAETSAECTGGKGPTTSECYFGGHTVFRQGFDAVQIQGVEFYQMGQGGRLGHYPVHFHHARKTAGQTVANQPHPDTYVMDSSIWDSMTRWIVLHGTQDVTLARNVGYKSIGHGFYLEDATEINNRLFANLGVFARAAVNNAQNPRKVPGILAAQDLDTLPGEQFPFKSDYDHPAVFWIMNGWNDFQYNLAAGAGACGACYWFVPGGNSTVSRVIGGKGPKWESYASLQTKEKGITPLKSFIGNSCSTAMTSFQTIGATEECKGLIDQKDNVAFYPPIHNELAPKWNEPDHKDANNLDDPHHLDYYPTVDTGGNRAATQCGGPSADPHADCSQTAKCSSSHPENCMVTVLDRYTTSFHWAPLNFAAIWLRPQWYLLTDSVITDVQQAGVTMVTGGGYSSSDVIPGHWALTRKSVFIGNTQDCPTCDVKDNPLASNGGPFNPKSTLRCATISADGNRPGDRCVNVDEGVTFPVNSFGMYQRLFSVYDGPAFQDSNAYLNIKHRVISDCTPFTDAAAKVGFCDVQPKPPIDSVWLAGVVQGLPKAKDATTQKEFCYMPNAAIGWKQPNGFYYPPAFHSRNLFFKDVDTRHFVVTPLFKEGTLETDIDRVSKAYCKWDRNLFAGFTSVDRQTVLNDDDGSLTGYTGPSKKPAIAINLDEFFTGPVEAVQCRSSESSKTSPYEWVTTVVYPQCATNGKCAAPATDSLGHRLPNPHTGDWDQACSNENCYGIPMYRLDLTKSDKGQAKSIRMMGQSTGQRSSLTVNQGTYYLDLTQDKTTQLNNFHTLDQGILKCDSPTTPVTQECNINVFKKNDTYYLFLIYAKEDTQQAYRFYVGPGVTDLKKNLDLHLVKANIGPNPVVFSAGGEIPAERVTWADQAKHIAQVVLKATDLPGFAANLKAARKNDCQPKTMCSWDDNETDSTKACKQCTSFDGAGNCLTKVASDICRWAGSDPHCPEGGCVGLAFTLPDGFTTGQGPDAKTVAAKDLKCSDTNFNVAFTKVSDGTCPAEGPSPAPDDRLELDFTDVVRTDKQAGDCQGQPYTAAWPFPHCQCPTP